MNGREFFERYWLSLTVVIGLVAFLAIFPSNAGDRSEVDTGFDTGFDVDSDADPFAAPSDTAPPGSAQPSDLAPVEDSTASSPSEAVGTPTTLAAGGSDGGATTTTQPAATGDPSGPPVVFGQGPNCRADGRQIGITFHMPPCAQWNGTDNGGATFRGVTEDEILVVKYRGQVDPGTEAALASANIADTAGVADRALRTLNRYWNLHGETYGREVKLIHVDASGPPTSEEAARADAIRIAQDIKPFAVIDENPAGPLPFVLAQELAQRGVLCFCTGQGAPRSSGALTELPPAIFAEQPTTDEHAAHVAEYIGKKLEGRPAEYAGDDQTIGQTFNQSERKYGLLYRNGAQGVVDPERELTPGIVRRELAKWGIGPDRIVEVGYNYQPGRNQADMTNIIARFKSEGVTTIVPFWDPITPLILTGEATRQQYYPEWLHTGTALSDITTGGRNYDQTQWQNSFGISAVWLVPEAVSDTAGFREYHHVCTEGCEPGDEGVLINLYRERIETFFIGVQMAGPVLTNDSFVRGMYNYPPTGGLPGAPLQFYTRQFPGEIKDFTEIWYDPDRIGPDERGEIGRGQIVKANRGRRYQLGEWTSDQNMFVQEGAMATASADTPGLDPPHEQDGHVHDPEQRCLSCR